LGGEAVFENSQEWVQFWIIPIIGHLLVALMCVIPYGLLLAFMRWNDGKIHPAIRLVANTILVLPYLFVLSLGMVLLALGIFGIYALAAGWWEPEKAWLTGVLLLLGGFYTWYLWFLTKPARAAADLYDGDEDQNRAAGRLCRYVLIFSIVSFILVTGVTQA
jgi:hypothetical protein